jgi:hypothetical protein
MCTVMLNTYYNVHSTSTLVILITFLSLQLTRMCDQRRVSNLYECTGCPLCCTTCHRSCNTTKRFALLKFYKTLYCSWIIHSNYCIQSSINKIATQTPLFTICIMHGICQYRYVCVSRYIKFELSILPRVYSWYYWYIFHMLVH